MTFIKQLSKSAASLVPLLGLLVASPALAHVSLERGEAARGASYKAVLKLPHGCDGEATQSVRVEIPEGFIGVKPMPKPGWKLDTASGPYGASYAYYHGQKLAEGVTSIVWSGGDLPDAYYDEFVAAGYLAKELKPGAALYFKVVQTCAKGEIKWDQVPADSADPHSLERPAAALKIAADENADAPAAKGAAVAIGSLSVENAWTRATAEGAKVGAGYLTIRNTGAAADTLVSIEAPFSKAAEIHDMTMTDGVMRMRELTEGLEIPAGGQAELKPGGMHLMFLGLTEPLVEGHPVKLKLVFKSGAAGEIEVPVKGLGASSAGVSSGHDH